MSAIYDKRHWFILEGFGFLGLGVLALILCGLLVDSEQMLYSLVLLLSGGLLMGRNVLTRQVPGTFFSFLGGCAFVVGGIIGLTWNSFSPSCMMWFLVTFFWIFAGCQCLTSLMRLNTQNWGLLFVTSIIIAIIGLILLVQPINAETWGTSILFGIGLIIYGGEQVVTALTAS